MASDADTDTETVEPKTIAIEIFGATYHVRGNDDSPYLQELAGTVDRTMRTIAEQVTTVDTAKIAILAALNLADELAQARRNQGGERVAVEEIEEIQEKVAALTGELQQALSG